MGQCVRDAQRDCPGYWRINVSRLRLEARSGCEEAIDQETCPPLEERFLGCLRGVVDDDPEARLRRGENALLLVPSAAYGAPRRPLRTL